jgi:hypothetical protein
MSIMCSPVGLPAGDYVYARRLLIYDRPLHDAVLSIAHVLREQLPQRDEAIEWFIPPWDAISAYHGRRVSRIKRHQSLRHDLLIY